MQHAIRDTGWLTSSYSGANRGNCVEVRLTDSEVDVRDTKDRPRGELTFSPAAWRVLRTQLDG